MKSKGRLFCFITAMLLLTRLHSEEGRPNALLQRALASAEATSSEDAAIDFKARRFGFQLFSAADVSSAPFQNRAALQNYPLGPGDELVIFMGGRVQQQQRLQVGSDGQLFLPTVGILPVTDLTIAELRAKLDERLRRIYSGYSLEIMLAAPKKISVWVAGEVVRPGLQTSGGFSFASDFIAQAGGPTDLAALRDVQIYRADTLFARIDLYDLILRPASVPEIFLRNGDRIFVPVVSSTVQIEGEVQRPAVYELNPQKSERLSDLIALAGGFTAYADRRNILVSRLSTDGRRAAFACCLADECVGESSDPLILDQDRITVFSILAQTPRDSVRIHGDVAAPGAFPFEKGMRISDLVRLAGGLNRSAFLLEADLARISPHQSLLKQKINLEAALAGDEAADLPLAPNDHLFVRRLPGWHTGQMVQVVGEVKFPGFYPIVEDSTTLFQVIQAAGGFTDDALIREMRLVRERKVMVEDKEYLRLRNMSRTDMSESEYEYFVMKQNTGEVNEVVVDYYRLFAKKDLAEDVRLKHGDVIHVPKRPDVVYVSGRVSNAGGVPYQSGAPVRYYIQKAGGFTWDADSRRAKVIKVNGEIKSLNSINTLEAGDRIWVPRKKEVNYWQAFRDLVMVMGQLAAVYLVIQTAKSK
ncbi:MAG: SLBB domain-containing protein [candidate division KSB1 bacterium]|nr:SLBB domain-containing protein [candidate division KSB1 bacterium]